METYRVDLSDSAEQDIRDIIRYISKELSVPKTAEAMLSTIEKSLDTLSTSPEIHPFVQDETLALSGFRKLIIKNYIAFYTVDDNNHIVNVIRVLYSRRDWQHII